MYKKVKITERLPELNKYVTTIDEAGDLRVCRLTESGWNMRDANGKNSPSGNLKIIFWLDEVNGLKGRDLIGKSKERFKDLEDYEWEWRSFYNGWLEGRMMLLQEIGYFNEFL